MRNPALAALCLAVTSLAAPALAQTARPPITAPPAAPLLTLSAEQRAAIGQAVARGRALALIDQAGRITTRDMLVRVPEAAQGDIVGWVGQPEGNAVAVTYFAREGEDYVAVYRGRMLGARVVSPEVFQAGSRPRLEGQAARMAAARAAVAGMEQRPCTGSAFNILVLPPQRPEDPILVYQISPRLTAARIPAGGHFRTVVNGDGTAGESVAPAGACEDVAVPAAVRGRTPRPLVVNARSADMPNELHVFLSLWAARPLAVATGTEQVRLWGVTGNGISELRQ